MDTLRRRALWALITGALYLIWLATIATGTIGWLFFALEVAMFALVVLFSFNHWNRKYQLHGGTYSLRARVDIFIPTKNEAPEILEETIRAAQNIDYASKTVYVIDDGGRPAVAQLAQKYGCVYLARHDWQIRRFKAATLNYGLQHSFGSYILILDADQVASPRIIDDLLGHFGDPTVALVATRQRFHITEDDFNHDHLFYEYMQTGKNADGAGMSCGSGVIYRRNALQAIGGFQEWNLIEDVTTSYMLNKHGYRTVYVNQSYTKGDAPHDLQVIYKQRGTWALDTLRLFFWKLPNLRKPRLTLRAWLHYFEMGYIYLVSGLFIPLVYYLNFYSLFTNTPVIKASLWYLAIKGPAFYFALKLYNQLGQGQSSSRMWAALFPVYLKAIGQALLFRKTRYVVTRKQFQPRRHLKLIIPQASTAALGLFAVAYHAAAYGSTPLFTINLFWLAIMLYWLYPVFPLALMPKSTHA